MTEKQQKFYEAATKLMRRCQVPEKDDSQLLISNDTFQLLRDSIPNWDEWIESDDREAQWVRTHANELFFYQLNTDCFVLHSFILHDLDKPHTFMLRVVDDGIQPEGVTAKTVRKVKLGFKKLNPRAIIPRYAHDGDAGMDVFALDDAVVPLHIPTMIHTGIAAEIPDGYELQVRPRSGLACKGVTVWNSPGTIDSKYRGEICVILMYMNREVLSTGDGTGVVPRQKYEVRSGDKIAQLVLAPVTFAEPIEVQELSETDRGTGGFGSTGR